MKTAFFSNDSHVYLVRSESELSSEDSGKLAWLLEAEVLEVDRLEGTFVGPRKEVLTPWSTNATEIAENVGLSGISRIEQFEEVPQGDYPSFDPMLEQSYSGLSAETLEISQKPEPLQFIENIADYNSEAGLALSDEEVTFLEEAQSKLGRSFTDCELYGFSQINSEHCRHKIFNGSFVINGEEQPKSLFKLIKETSATSPDQLVSAYKDNVAFIKGPKLTLFTPSERAKSSLFAVSEADSVISIKAETHNFPTTVEPFNGASTGSGGEIRDRMAGGIGSVPLAGTAVYMTAYPRMKGAEAVKWEKNFKERDWKYQTPSQILVKASNGASDFGNKFGQPLIVGSTLTFEGKSVRGFFAYDRTIMLAGGVGYARAEYALKLHPKPGDKIVLIGGDNYRIGMAGGSVSSVDSGALSRDLELSAVQRANPEMQKRVNNAIRNLSEHTANPVIMIHDHGAGGHINCFSELLEEQGGRINVSALPVGDPTLSLKEIICNESQERMGLVVSAEDVDLVREICERERAPFYLIGEVTGDNQIVFETEAGEKPIDIPVEFLFGSSPRTVLQDEREVVEEDPLEYNIDNGAALKQALTTTLSLEGVACKDWLTNKVDRCVTGLVAQQQCVGPLHLPLNNAGVMALDYQGKSGVASSIGHAPVVGLIDAEKGSVLSVAEALTNVVFTPLEQGLKSLVLSANWMWPAKQPGEDARLYSAVEALGRFSQDLGIAVPTGKDSLSMTMKYEDGQSVRAPGTVIVSAVGHCDDIKRCVTPDLKPRVGSAIVHLDFSGLAEFPLGGSSFAQSIGQLGDEAPSVSSADYFSKAFEFVQTLLRKDEILAGHDVSGGGLLSAICEMAFTGDVGVSIAIPQNSNDYVAKLFCEKPGVLLQLENDRAKDIVKDAQDLGLVAEVVAEVAGNQVQFHSDHHSFVAPVAELRRAWFKPSFLLDSKQTKPSLAKERYERFDAHPLSYSFPKGFTGKLTELGIDLKRTASTGTRAAVIRDKGTNGEREMALCLFAAGFDVVDVTMSDLMEGRASLDDVQFAVFPGGFSNSDVLGAAKGWAGVFKYNEKAKAVFDSFLAREDTLSLGVCNGCQLLVGMDAVYPEHQKKMQMANNESDKFESSFVNVKVSEQTNSVMLKALVGSTLGIWVAHGEGRFVLPEGEEQYDIPLKYTTADYPANPNGSDFNAAAVCSRDGRHLAIMPHLERSMFSWNWPYRGEQEGFEASPWILGFISAREWIEKGK